MVPKVRCRNQDLPGIGDAMRERRRSLRISHLERIVHGRVDSMEGGESHHHAGSHPGRRAHERVTAKGDLHHSIHQKPKVHSKQKGEFI